MKISYEITNPWYRMSNAEKHKEHRHTSKTISHGELYSLIEGKVGRVRMMYEIVVKKETRPLKKTSKASFENMDTLTIKVQLQWPRGIRRYCEDHFEEIRLGSATNDRCDCGKYNIANEEEVMCHTCALRKRVCAVCQKPVDLEAEQEAVEEECDVYDIPVPDDDDLYPLDFSWLHRNQE